MERGILYINPIGIFFEPTLLNHMKGGNNDEVLSTLQGVNPCQLRDSTGMTLLHFAAEYGNKRIAKYLIKLGVDVNALNHVNETPLIVAMENNQLELVKVLLRANADIFIPNLRGQCALGKVLRNEMGFSEKIIKALLDRVMSETLRNSIHVQSDVFHSDCPLYYFIPMKNVHITRILLEKGSPVDAIDPVTHNTALHEAFKQLDIDHIILLIEYKANIMSQNRTNATPVEMIRVQVDGDYNKMLVILKFLLEMGLRNYNLFENLVQNLLMYGRREIVNASLPCIMNLFANTPVGNFLSEPLFYLCLNRTNDILQELRGFDFDVNARGTLGRTMLHCAAEVGNVSSVRFLIDHGADVNAEDDTHSTPLRRLIEYAMCSTFPINDTELWSLLRCVEILLDHDADPEIFVRGHRLTHVTVYRQKISYNVLTLLDPIFHRVALLEVSGPGVQLAMRREIMSSPEFENSFMWNKLQLEEIKNIKIDKDVTLLDFVAESETMISFYALKKGLAVSLDNILRKHCQTDSYCHTKVRRRFKILMELVSMREKVATTLNEILMDVYNISVYEVALKIINYMQDEDVCKMTYVFT